MRSRRSPSCAPEVPPELDEAVRLCLRARGRTGATPPPFSSPQAIEAGRRGESTDVTRRLALEDTRRHPGHAGRGRRPPRAPSARAPRRCPPQAPRTPAPVTRPERRSRDDAQRAQAGGAPAPAGHLPRPARDPRGDRRGRPGAPDLDRRIRCSRWSAEHACRTRSTGCGTSSRSTRAEPGGVVGVAAGRDRLPQSAHQLLHEGEVVERQQPRGGRLVRRAAGSAGRRACASRQAGQPQPSAIGSRLVAVGALREVEPPAPRPGPGRARCRGGRAGWAWRSRRGRCPAPTAWSMSSTSPMPSRCRGRSSSSPRSDQPTTSRICSFDCPSEPPIAIPSTGAAFT